MANLNDVIGNEGYRGRMTWIIFDEADHYSPAPSFCLQSIREERICLRDYQGDCSLVLVFTHGADCSSCLETLSEFASRRGEYLDEDAEILAVLPEEPSDLAANPQLSDLPIALLSDPDGAVRRAYAGLMDESLVEPDDSLLFVLDRYNAPYAALIAPDLGGSTLHQDVQSWLAYIGVQCPE